MNLFTALMGKDKTVLHLVSLEKQEYLEATRIHRRWLHGRSVLGLLAVPSSTPMSTDHNKDLSQTSSEQDLSQLSLEDCFRLSITTAESFDLTFSCVEQRLTKLLGQWAGSRIICAPTDIGSDSTSVGLFTSKERNASVGDVSAQEAGSNTDECTLTGNMNLGEVVSLRYHEVYHAKRCLPFDEACESLRQIALTETIDHLPEGARQRIHDALVGEGFPKALLPANKSWVLRNLTAKQYVCADGLRAALDVKRSQPCGPDIRYPGLAEAVLCRVGWTSEGSCNGHDVPKNFSIWAGHRFEVTTDTHHRAHSDATWEDVTEEVVDDFVVSLHLKRRGQSRRDKRMEKRRKVKKR